MTKTIPVSAHTRRVPEKKPDPLSAEIEAKRHRFQSKWGVEVISANDDGHAQPSRPTVIERFMPWFGRRR